LASYFANAVLMSWAKQHPVEVRRVGAPLLVAVAASWAVSIAQAPVCRPALLQSAL
jgi:hypothetical protein